jgi:gliding motility-associated-like protein
VAKRFLYIAISVLYWNCIHAQKFLNGSFEQVVLKTGSGHNLHAFQFDSIVANGIRATGDISQQLVFAVNSGHTIFNYPYWDTLMPYPDGTRCVSLRHFQKFPIPQNPPDFKIPTIFLGLSSPLQVGTPYLFRFFGYTSPTSVYTIFDSILIGTCTDTFVVDDTLMIATPARGRWTEHAKLFVAENPTQYISVRNFTGPVQEYGHNLIDHFRIHRLEGFNKHTLELCTGDSVKLNPSSAGVTEWNRPDGEIKSFPFFYAKAPGIYFGITETTDSTLVIDTFEVTEGNRTLVAVTDTLKCPSIPLSLASRLSQTANATFAWSDGSTGPALTVKEQGMYWCIASVGSCVYCDTFHVTEHPDQDLLVPRDTSICGTITLQLDINPSLYGILWSDGTQGPSTRVSGAGWFYVEASDSFCTYYDTIQVNRFDLPYIGLPKHIVLCLDELEGILLSAPGGYQSYLWRPTEERTASIFANQARQYLVEVTDYSGCMNSDSVYIDENCSPKIWIPNAFSPNGDGINDRFIVTIHGALRVRLNIYNRWGEEVADIADAVRAGWDGTFNGRPATPDTYLYLATITDASGKNSFRKGNVTLLR